MTASRPFAFVAAFALLGSLGARAQDAAEFYRGRTVTLMVGSSSGGMYDLLGRLVARHLGAKLPGNPTVIVENRSGGGGLAPPLWLYNSAPKDGTAIGLVSDMIPYAPLFGTPQATYDSQKFNWIGSSNPETGFLMVWSEAPVNSLDDVRKRETTMGVTGANGAPAFFARVLNETLGTKLKLVVGYPGSSEIWLAISKGEVDGFPSAFTTDLTALKPDWIRDRKVKLLVQYGSHREPGFESVPFASDLVTKQADKELMSAAFALLDTGRPFVMPPGVPQERVAVMRKALADVFADPQVRAEAERMSLAIDRSQSGEEVRDIVARAYASPPAAVERVRKLLQQQ